MKICKLHLLALALGGLFFANNAPATNPLIMDQFTADPTARVFEGQVYLYPSHDIPYSPGRGRTNWFIMEDYHVFSSSNLVDWTDHGIIINQTNVPWLNRYAFNMWAPDCVFKDGKYYFYFPVGGRIGVATSEKPYGPWKVLDKPVTGVGGIDPCVLIDDDGSAYLFTGARGIAVSKLKDNMVESDGSSRRIANLPSPGLIEGPFAFKRNGIYYLTYPHAVTNAAGHEGAERLEYSISTNVFGPYKWMGIITDQNESGCWTEHHSIVQYQGQWYLFYHDNQLSPNFDKNRSVRADCLYFNNDGTIQKVIPTLRGVGIVDANSKIQIDRYSAVSKEGASAPFLDPSNTFAGWRVSFNGSDAWARFDRVDFGKGGMRWVFVRAVAPTDSVVQIRLDSVDGPVVAKVEIGKSKKWTIARTSLAAAPTGIHDLVVCQDGNKAVDIDWVSFR